MTSQNDLKTMNWEEILTLAESAHSRANTNAIKGQADIRAHIIDEFIEYFSSMYLKAKGKEYFSRREMETIIQPAFRQFARDIYDGNGFLDITTPKEFSSAIRGLYTKLSKLGTDGEKPRKQALLNFFIDLTHTEQFDSAGIPKIDLRNQKLGEIGEDGYFSKLVRSDDPAWENVINETRPFYSWPGKHVEINGLRFLRYDLGAEGVEGTVKCVVCHDGSLVEVEKFEQLIKERYADYPEGEYPRIHEFDIPKQIIDLQIKPNEHTLHEKNKYLYEVRDEIHNNANFNEAKLNGVTEKSTRAVCLDAGSVTGLIIRSELNPLKSELEKLGYDIWDIANEERYNDMKSQLSSKLIGYAERAKPRVEEFEGIINLAVEKAFEGKSPVSNPQLFMTIGGTGVGKSMMEEKAYKTTQGNIVEASLDDARFLSNLMETYQAADYHRDDYLCLNALAQETCKRIEKRAISEGYNYGCFRSGIPFEGKKYQGLVEKAEDRGYKSYIIAGMGDFVAYPDDLKKGNRQVMDNVISRFEKTGRAVPWSVTRDKNIKSFISAIQAVDSISTSEYERGAVIYDLAPERSKKYLLAKRALVNGKALEELEQANDIHGALERLGLLEGFLPPQDQDEAAKFGYSVRRNLESGNTILLVTSNVERMQDLAMQTLYNKEARGLDTLFKNTNPEIEGAFIHMRKELMNDNGSPYDALSARKKAPELLEKRLLKMLFEVTGGNAHSDKVMAISRDLRMLCQLRKEYDEASNRKLTKSTEEDDLGYENMNGNDIINSMPFSPSATSHPTETLNEESRKILSEMRDVMEGAAKGWFVDKATGVKYSLQPNASSEAERHADEYLDEEEAKAFIDTNLRDLLKDLYQVMEIPHLRELFSYETSTRRMSAAEEAERVREASKNAYDALPDIISARLKSYIKSPECQYSSVEELIEKEPKLYEAISKKSFQFYSWAFDQDNKPKNTARDVALTSENDQIRVLEWYLIDLAEIYQHMEEKSPEHPKLKEINRMFEGCLNYIGGFGTENNRLDQKFVEELIEQKQELIPENPRCKVLSTAITQFKNLVGAEDGHKPYKSAKEFIDDIRTLGSSLQGEDRKLLAPQLDRSGHETGMTKLDSLLAKAITFGNTVAKGQARQTSDVHDKVFQVVNEVFERIQQSSADNANLFVQDKESFVKLKEALSDSGFDEKQKQLPAEYKITIMLQKDTSGVLRKFIREEILDTINEPQKEMNENLQHLIFSLTEKHKLDGGTRDEGILFQTLQTLRQGCDNPYSFSANIVSHSYASESFEDAVKEALRTIILTELVENPDFLAEGKRHKPSFIALKEDFVSLVPEYDEGLGRTVSRSARIMNKLLQIDYVKEHFIQTSIPSKNSNWLVYDPSHEHADENGMRPMTLAEGKLKLGYIPNEGDDRKSLKGSITSMSAGSDFGRENGGWESILIREANRDEALIALENGFFYEDFLGAGTSTQYRQGGRFDSHRITVQGLGKIFYLSPEGIIKTTEDTQALQSKLANSATKITRKREHNRDIINQVFSDGQQISQKILVSWASKDSRVKLNSSNHYALPELEKNNEIDNKLIQDINSRSVKASKYVQRLMDKDSKESKWYTQLFQLASPTGFTKWFNFSNRPDTGKSQQIVSGKTGIKAKEENFDDIYKFLGIPPEVKLPGDPKVSGQRAIGYGASIANSGLCSNAYEGWSVFMNLRNEVDGALKSEALNGDRSPEMDKMLVAIKTAPSVQDLISKKMVGMLNANLDAAWKFTGFERLAGNQIRHIRSGECFDIADLASIADTQSGEVKMLSDGTKVPEMVHLMAHFDQEYQLAAVNLTELYHNLNGKSLSKEERLDLIQKAANHPEEIRKELMKVSPQSLVSEIESNRKGVSVVQLADKQDIGGFKDAQSQLADAWHEVLRNGGYLDKYSDAVRSKEMTKSEAIENSKADVYPLWHNTFAAHESIINAVRNPDVHKTQRNTVALTA